MLGQGLWKLCPPTQKKTAQIILDLLGVSYIS